MPEPTRPHLVQFRASDTELAQIQNDADRAGLTRSDYLRLCICNSPLPRAYRLTKGDAQVLRRILGELGKVGSNLNQMVRYTHQTRDPHPFETQLAQYGQVLLEIRHQIRRALGAESGNDNHKTDTVTIHRDDHQVFQPGQRKATR